MRLGCLWLQQGVSIRSSINLGKTFPQISRIRIIPSTQILARVFAYLPPFISQILDFIYRIVLIFILIYFEWRDTENQQYILLRKRKDDYKRIPLLGMMFDVRSFHEYDQQNVTFCKLIIGIHYIHFTSVLTPVQLLNF